MKIYILPVDKKLRPRNQLFKYPAHNNDYGVEQDFYLYLSRNKKLTTSNPAEADWHYLPVFWTRWHLNHDYGKNGLNELQTAVDNVLINDQKTFTVCQYDDGPLINIGTSKQFLASRKNEDGTDIPLLSSNHHRPLFRPAKKYIASFVGRLSTHKIRAEMADELSKIKDILIADGNFGPKYFVKNTLKSYISLCPRGYGGSSFRLFESMQLGTAPFLIGDLDTRPFKDFIDWNKISFYADDPKKIKTILGSKSKEELIAIGRAAKKAYKNYLRYQKWCPYVIKELEKNNQIKI